MNEVFTTAGNEFRQKIPQLSRKLEVRIKQMPKKHTNLKWNLDMNVKSTLTHTTTLTPSHPIQNIPFTPFRYPDSIENPSKSSHPGQSIAKSSSTKRTNSAHASKRAKPPTKPRPSASSRKPTLNYTKIAILIHTAYHSCLVGVCS